MTHHFLFLVLLLPVAALAEAPTYTSDAAVAEYRAETQAWYRAYGTGSFDLSALATTNQVTHTADGDGAVTHWRVEIVGRRDGDTDACVWGWAMTDLAHLPRNSAQRVLAYAEARNLNDLLVGTTKRDHFACAQLMAYATLIGEIAFIHLLPYEGSSYYLGFRAEQGDVSS